MCIFKSKIRNLECPKQKGKFSKPILDFPSDKLPAVVRGLKGEIAKEKFR
jgi:hypothetical protein